MEWELIADGEVLQKGIASDIQAGPQQSVELAIPYDASMVSDGREWFLNVSYKLKKSEQLLPAGYTVAYNQIELAGYDFPELSISNRNEVNCEASVPEIVTNDRFYLIVKGENFVLDFSRKDGFISYYEVDGHSMLAEDSEIRPNFWRAPTDNDYGANLQHKYGVWKNPNFRLKSLETM